MEKRHSWITALERAWQRHRIVWLSGVRRTGKTTLCKSLPDIRYFDCELPSVRRLVEDPEDFLKAQGSGLLALDEIHHLPDPSNLLKIAADHFPKLRIIATGSSTLGASAKFKDTLTGRKADVWLTPMNSLDLVDLGQGDLRRRLHQGGLPPYFLRPDFSEVEFKDWLDSYWAKDVQELFRVERRGSFLRFVELLFAQSGGIFEPNKLAGPCEVSRNTLNNYLSILEATYLVQVVRPYSTHRATEIVSAPKVYGFDTGFVVHAKGWGELRPEDLGQLWEHYVLNELQSRLQYRGIHYWRDKQGHEIDFIVAGRDGRLLALECKWKAKKFEPQAFAIFKRAYPKAVCVLVAPDITRKLHHSAQDWHEWTLDDVVAEAEKVLNPSKRVP